jgi:SAM-dependent methyltransferase
MSPGCPLCADPRVTLCLERSDVPVFQNIRYASPEAARGAATGKLAISECDRCGFVFNAGFDPALAVYSADYENDQTQSERFRSYLDQIAARVLGAISGRPQPTVLEIGCGQASFLKQLAGLPDARYSRFVGFDPAWRGGDTPSTLEIRPQLFDSAAAIALDSRIDAVVSRHVIEHVPDPVRFLRDIAQAIGSSARPTLMLETPCLAWILQHEVDFDFFYEHCNYFTIETLGFALARAGYRARKIEHVFDGQYLWAEAEPAPDSPDLLPVPTPRGHGAAIQAMGERGEARLAAWRDRLAACRRCGPVALWGAGAKGATLAALADPDGGLIDCLIDINPRKQGGFNAVTAHAIVPPATAAARGVRVVVPMNPNYRDEIGRMIRDAALPFTLFDEP